MTESAAMSRVLSVSHGEVELEDHPINPEWVLEGNPRARISQWAESDDGFVSHWTWDCTAGRFRWYYDVDETIVIINGAVSIEVDDEPPVPLQVGDAAYFAAGHWVTWTVPDYVRKQAIVRVPVPRTMRYVAKGLGRRAHRLRNAAP
jgi:uncharacterized protein